MLQGSKRYRACAPLLWLRAATANSVQARCVLDGCQWQFCGGGQAGGRGVLVPRGRSSHG